MTLPQRILTPGEVEPGALAVLKDGRLVSCSIEMHPDWMSHLDQDTPDHWAYIRYSDDGGQTWTAPRQSLRYAGGPGYALTCVPVVDQAGRLHMLSLRYFKLGWQNNDWHCILLHHVSSDGGETWSEPKEVDFGHRYTGSLNSTLCLDNGRIVVPLAFLDENRTTGRFVSTAVYSDDGETWHKSNDCVVDSGGAYIESGACEPVIVQLNSGLVWMVIRTQTGLFWESFSNAGAVWTPPIPTRIMASNAPAGLLRLADGRIVMIWNNLYGEPMREGISYARQILHAAISDNDGQTWSRPKVVAQLNEGEPFNAQTTYPFLVQAPDGAIVLLYHRIRAQPNRDWHDPVREIVRFDPDWLVQ